MQKVFRFYPLVVPLVLWSFLALIIHSQWYQRQPETLSFALTVDFLIIIPMLYFLAIRKREIPRITVFSVFVLGLLIASFLIPEQDQRALDSFKTYFLPLIELVLVVFILRKTIKTIKEFKRNKRNSDFHTTLLITTHELFPKGVSYLLATEISTVYYALFVWRSKQLSKNEFTYHKKNALLSIIAGLTLVIIGETIALHSWLVGWNHIFGWIITFLSAYTAVQFFALLKSILQRPIAIDTQDQNLHFKYGFFSDAIFPFDWIDSVELNTSDLPEDKSIQPLSPLGSIGEHNVIIHFKDTITVKGFYGLKKRAKSFAIFVDEKEVFVEVLKRNMLKSS